MQSDILPPRRSAQQATQPTGQQQAVGSQPQPQPAPSVGNDMNAPTSELHLGISPRTPSGEPSQQISQQVPAQGQQPAPPVEQTIQAEAAPTPAQEAPVVAQQPQLQQQSAPKAHKSHSAAITIAIAVIIFLALSGLAIYNELNKSSAA